MGVRTINRYVLSNLSNRPVRALLSVAAIAVEVAMILTLVGVSYGTLDATARRARGVGADILIRPPGSSVIGLSSAPMSDKLVPYLMTLPHITVATGTMVQPLAGLDTITGLDLDSFDRMSGGFHFLSGGPFQQDNDILVDEYYAREKHVRVGDTLDLIGHTWDVRGIFESGKLTRMAVRLAVLQRDTGNDGRLSQIFLKLDNPKLADQVISELRQKLPGYPIYTMEEFTSLLTVNSIGLLRDFINVVIGVATVVGFIVVYMAMHGAVLERTHEIGVLKSLGASSRLILSILLKEVFVLAVCGVIAGILLTYASKWAMTYFAPSTLAQVTVYGWWPIAAAIALVGSLLGATVPAIKAVRQDVIRALAYE